MTVVSPTPQLSALLPTANIRMNKFGERYCQGGNNRFDKYAGAHAEAWSGPVKFAGHTGSTILTRCQQLPAWRGLGIRCHDGGVLAEGM